MPPNERVIEDVATLKESVRSLREKLDETEERCKERDNLQESKIVEVKATLEAKIASTNERVEGVEEELSLYKKYRWVGSGAAATGILIMMGWKEAREKLLGWLFP